MNAWSRSGSSECKSRPDWLPACDFEFKVLLQGSDKVGVELAVKRRSVDT